MDRRNKYEKLKAMADQSVSPHEAEIAKQKIAEMEKDYAKERAYTAKAGAARNFAFTVTWFNFNEYPMSSGSPYFVFSYAEE